MAESTPKTTGGAFRKGLLLTITGGPAQEPAEYFFAPSIVLFENSLAGGTKKRVTEDEQRFELRHRRGEDEQETKLVQPQVRNDDALPLTFEERVTLDGAEEGAAAEVVDEWLAPSTAL